MLRGSGCSPFFQPAYCAVASPAASVGTEGDLVLGHQLEDLGGAVVAVLDGLGAGENGAAHALGRGGVDRDRDAGALRGLHRELHFLEREGGMRAGPGAPAVVAVELDPIGAVADLVADHADERVDAVGLLGALGHAEFEREALGRVAAGGDDGARGGEHARAGNDALIDGLLELDIGVAGALGAEVAHGGEAGHQGGAQMIDGAGGAQGEALVHHLVVPRGLVVGVEQNVRVAFDQAGQQGRAGQVDHLGVGGVDGGGGTGGLDASRRARAPPSLRARSRRRRRGRV